MKTPAKPKPVRAVYKTSAGHVNRAQSLSPAPRWVERTPSQGLATGLSAPGDSVAEDRLLINTSIFAFARRS